MKPKSNWIELGGLCALFILLSIWGIVWDITSGLLASGIDGIMLLFICLMMGGIFSLMLVATLWQAGLIPAFKKAAASDKPEAAAKSATPASAAAPPPASAPAQKTSQPVQSTPTTK